MITASQAAMYQHKFQHHNYS